MWKEIAIGVIALIAIGLIVGNKGGTTGLKTLVTGTNELVSELERQNTQGAGPTGG